MVMLKRIPQRRCDRKIQMPPTKNQMIFMMVERQPWGDSLCTILLPKGHRASMPSLMVCRPNGMPMIVTNRAMLEIKYCTATMIPPNTSQMMFPNIFMFPKVL